MRLAVRWWFFKLSLSDFFFAVFMGLRNSCRFVARVGITLLILVLWPLVVAYELFDSMGGR